MSLDTILQIGKILRHSDNSLKYFKYVGQCTEDKDGNWPICITIPVNENFTFDWDGIYITPENQREKLFYLKYSTSDNDSSPKKYLFGDICYTRKCEIDKSGKIKGIKDFGNFTFEKGNENAFINAQKAYYEICDNLLIKFIKLELSDKVEEKDIDIISKFILTSYRKNKPVDIPKKIWKYQLIIEASLKKLKSIEENNDLIKFHLAFEKNIDIFSRILLYAPVFEAYNNDKETIRNSLIDINVVRENYLSIIKDKHQVILKKLLTKDETLESFGDDTRDKLLLYADFSIFIHFEFSDNGKKISWFQHNEVFDIIKDKLNSEITNLSEEGFVPSKSIYRTLCSGDDKNDIQFPSFNLQKSYKSFAFKDKEIFEDFLYTGSILNRPFRRLKYTNIDMFVFPATFDGESINAKDYDDFFFDKKDETRLEYDPIFSIFDNEGAKRFNRFDFVFSDSGGNTTNDLVEISGIEKSMLRTIQSRIQVIENEISLERESEISSVSEFNKLYIEVSFRNILGNTFVGSNGRIAVKANAKYKSHLLKVLPLIYTSNYFNDDLLLPSFIQVSEFIVRNIEKKFIWYNYTDLKYHLKFLLKIQNTNNNKFMEITSSESYKIGFMLGGMAKNLSLEINSFEKNYVGNLTRRVGTLSDFIKLKNEIEQKLIMHDKTKFTYQTSYDLAQNIKEFKSRYDKEECAFGFLESYFKPFPKKENESKENVNN
jgi:hypothetical protein